MNHYEDVTCPNKHKLEIVSEGYGVCCTSGEYGLKLIWAAWAFSKPVSNRFYAYSLIGKDGSRIPAWVSHAFLDSKEEALALIQKDIDMRRALPFDEERERERLMPV